MGRTNALAVLAALMMVIASSAVAAPAAGKAVPKGQQVFLATKCNKCHAVSSAGIERVAPGDSDEEAAEEGDIEPPDLSDAGSRFASAAEVKAWLDKTLERKGRLHQYKFRGTPADFEQLTQWLLTLKQPAPKK